jgi:hypothetical protein
MAENKASSRDPAAGVEIVSSVTLLDARHRGRVVIAGSHGGVYAGYLAAQGGVRGVVLNDAGIGKDAAGILSLAYLDRLGVAAATVSHLSARIGDGADMAARGIVSHVNETERRAGCAPGQTARDCARAMTLVPLRDSPPEPRAEARYLLEAQPGRPEIWGFDSASLLRPEDAGRIVVTASHGAILDGKPDGVVAMDVYAAVFHDAGIGADGAGVSRLPTLDARAIPAAAVAADSARIGDARSVYETGVISRVNDTARARGATPGQTTRTFIARL